VEPRGIEPIDLMTASQNTPLMTKPHAVMLTLHLQRVEAISRKINITAFHCVSIKICHKIVTRFANRM
jgi:hypothetical protein